MSDQTAYTRKVLVVDDNPDLRTVFSRAFSRQDFEVRIAADGREAIACLAESLPDVMILDLNMPYVDGFGVLDDLRGRPGGDDVKVVVVSGNPIAARAPEAAKADLVLIKPVDLRELVLLARRLTPHKSGDVTV